jgi:hypothetical protein
MHEMASSGFLINLSLDTNNEELVNRINSIKMKCPDIIRLKILTTQFLLSEDINDYIPHERMTIHNTLAVPPFGFQRRYTKVGCAIRSNPEFHEKEAYSDVVIRAENEGEMEMDKYCKIFMIYSCTVKNKYDRDSRVENLCFVKYYEEVDMDETLGMPILEWKTGDETVGIIRVEQIVRPANVVDRRINGKFYLNTHIF